MSTAVPTPELHAWRRRSPRSPSWLREPLLHFIAIGGLLFALDHVLVSRTADPHVIVVSADVDQQARSVFKASRGRAPNADELYALRRVWLDNEVLYREGLALQVDKGDDAIRERVIFKALSVIDAGVKLPSYDDTLLRQWFESHRAKYDEPPRYDFQEAVLVGESSEAAVRSFVAALNAGMPGDAQAGLRVFKGRPRQSVVQAYGDGFATQLATTPPGEWTALDTTGGWRAVRLDATAALKPAVYESLRGVVLQDWTDATLSEQRSAAVHALAKKYQVKVEAEAQ